MAKGHHGPRPVHGRDHTSDASQREAQRGTRCLDNENYGSQALKRVRRSLRSHAVPCNLGRGRHIHEHGDHREYHRREDRRIVCRSRGRFRDLKVALYGRIPTRLGPVVTVVGFTGVRSATRGALAVGATNAPPFDPSPAITITADNQPAVEQRTGQPEPD